MATKKTIFQRLLFRFTFTTLVTVNDSSPATTKSPRFPISLASIPTLNPLILSDARSPQKLAPDGVYKHRPLELFSSHFKLQSFEYLYYPLRFYQTILKMGDNLQRAVQDLDLGVEDEPFALPEMVVNQAAAENRFIIVGRPTIPRRQNLRSIIANLPRMWGYGGLIHGRIIAGGQFQFVFPTEEMLENVLRRGPWAFSDRMLVLQRWTPQLDPVMLNFIPFWVQVRGIPLQFLNEDVIRHIGCAMGMVLEVEFDAEAAARVEFARFCINWDITRPLRFQRNFQFSAGINTLLRFRYERLRGFCEVCCMITHDSGACLIQNGGPDHPSDGDDDEANEQDPMPQQNHGVLIREIDDDEAAEDPEVQDNEGQHEVNVMQEDHEVEEEDHIIEEEDLTMEETHELVNSNRETDLQGINGKEQHTYGRKRKFPTSDFTGAGYKLLIRGQGESSGEATPDTTTKTEGGAVGPEPPLPP
ncbi:uncharacterized protein LOC112082109 [Eutrema salsugineum]|uniref:uncharacterized protein LOC112082109 n=1 Tax=Eutrema salsugineum TaxID=72664 RepID=UPI000CED341A|nr:uncharacterized protein LOC112082109 [Eutrema salsugineum]